MILNLFFVVYLLFRYGLNAQKVMTKSESVILRYLDDNGLDVFFKRDIETKVDLTPDEFKLGFRGLSQKAQILLIEKGKYRRRYFSDENVIGCFMVPNGGIAYWSALNAHGLTEQFPNKTFIQNSMRRGEKVISGLGTVFHFVTVKKEKLIGYKTFGYGNHAYYMTDVEKTIVDCFDLPQYAGGYNEIVKAFNKAKLNPRKMVAYSKAINNISVTKRLAYLSELLEKPRMNYFLEYATQVCNEKYSPFDPTLPSKGVYLKRWRLILNIDEDEIKELSASLY